MTTQTYKIGDCLELLKAVESQSIDLILTDPPYNIGLDYGCYVDDKRKDYKEWCSMWFSESKRVSKSIIITPGFKNLKMWIKEIEYPKGVAVLYAPNQCCHSNLGGFNHWEPILVYGKVCLSYNVFKTVIKQQKDTGNHPCPKQLDLFKSILAACNPKPQSVLDIFAGSGTTLRACLELNIEKSIGFEINPDYEKIIRKRALKDIKTLSGWVT